MPDRVETMRRSVIQHGKRNDRIYLMKLHSGDLPGLVDDMAKLARERSYSKIFAKVPLSEAEPFAERGYRREAMVPRFFAGTESCAFMSLFLKAERGVDPDAAMSLDIVELAKQKGRDAASDPGDPPYEILAAEPEHAEELGRLYREVFDSYPFPIHDPGYLRETMDDHVRYFCALDGGSIVAASSAEMDREERNVEMTDFATLPGRRGGGIAVHLLRRMEEEMRRLGMLTAYTIARSASPGMNITFARCGYAFGGRLVNNTDISGRIESMNVWHKTLLEKLP
jgi:beta-lysine N6-acetyltransferase